MRPAKETEPNLEVEIDLQEQMEVQLNSIPDQLRDATRLGDLETIQALQKRRSELPELILGQKCKVLTLRMKKNRVELEAFKQEYQATVKDNNEKLPKLTQESEALQSHYETEKMRLEHGLMEIREFCFAGIRRIHEFGQEFESLQKQLDALVQQVGQPN